MNLRSACTLALLCAPTIAQAQLSGFNLGGCIPNKSAFFGREIGSCAVAGLKSFGLKNRGNVDIKFNLKPDNAGWTTLVIRANGEEAVFCTGCSTITFAIQTEGSDEITYSLDLGSRYALFWNEKRAAWDLVRTEKN